MQIILLPLDLLPTYIPFVVQCNKADGTKSDPTADNLIIYEEGGADGTFDSTTITGSPFDPAQINSKTGLWGKLIAKSAFTAGKLYIAVWEVTVDSKTTAAVEVYFACNASDFRATGFAVPGSAMTLTAAYDAAKTALPASGYTAPDNAGISAIKSKTDLLPASPAAVGSAMTLTSAYDAAKTAFQASGYTAPDNAGISAIKAKTDLLPASPAAVGSAMTLTAAYDAAKTALPASGYTAPDNAGIAAIKAKTDLLPSDPASQSAIRGTDGDTLKSISDQIDNISDITVNMDATGLATQQTVEAIKAKTDNLPSDPVSASALSTALALLFANVAGDVWSNPDRTLTGDVSVDADSFHSALNSWDIPTEPPIPPIILPPSNAEDCRVYLWIGGQSASVIPDTIDKATAKIVRLPYTSGGRFFAGMEVSGTYAPDTGMLYWDIVRGASVLVTVPVLGLYNREITVPESGTYAIESE